jgi:hypothetical protein
MSPRNVPGFRRAGGRAFRVAAKKSRHGETGYGVNPAIRLRAGSRRRDLSARVGASQAVRKPVLSRGAPRDGHLQALLERGYGARCVGEGGGEMAQGHGIGESVATARRRGRQYEAGADMAGEITPSCEPAAGRAPREGWQRVPPRGVCGDGRRTTLKETEKLTGPQRAIRDDILPMDRKCTPAA